MILFGFWNQTQVLFLYLRTTMHELMTAEHHLDCANVRAFLDKRGIRSEQFVQDQMPTIYELAEELTSKGMGHLVLYVDSKNYWINHLLTREVKAIDPMLSIVWIGPIEEYAEIDSQLVDKALHAHDGDQLYQWIQQEDSIASSHETGEQTEECMPYTDGWIPAERAGSVGLRIGGSHAQALVERVRTELHTLHSKGVRGVLQFQDRDLLENVEVFKAIIQLLTETNYEFKFKGSIRSEALNEGTILLLHKGNFVELDVEFVIPADGDESKITENIQQLLRWSEQYGVILNSRFVNGTNRGPINNRFAVSHKSVWDSYPSHNTHEKAFINGYISYTTGLYPPNVLTGSAKHVGVTSNLLNENQYVALKEFISINSSLIVESALSPEDKQDDLVYGEGDSILRISNSLYETNVNTTRKAQAVTPHLVQEIPSTDAFRYEIQIDDFYYNGERFIDKRSYSEAGKERQQFHDIQFLSIETEQDLDAFIQDVSHFSRTGRMKNYYQASSLLTDSCRWGASSACKLCQLPRFRVGDDDQIMPCGGSKQSIGNLSDGYPIVLQNAGAISEEEQLLRGCRSCEVKEQCSKCAVLPDFMSREQYCSMKKQNPEISWYISVTSMLQMLSKTSALFKGFAIEDIRISSKSVSHYYTGQDLPSETPLATEFAFLFSIDEKPYLYNARTQKVLKLNEPMAVMFEAFMKGINKLSLVNYLQTAYSIAMEQANEAVEQAMRHFSNAGCLREAAPIY